MGEGQRKGSAIWREATTDDQCYLIRVISGGRQKRKMEIGGILGGIV